MYTPAAELRGWPVGRVSAPHTRGDWRRRDETHGRARAARTLWLRAHEHAPGQRAQEPRPWSVWVGGRRLHPKPRLGTAVGMGVWRVEREYSSRQSGASHIWVWSTCQRGRRRLRFLSRGNERRHGAAHRKARARDASGDGQELVGQQPACVLLRSGRGACCIVRGARGLRSER